MITVATMTHPQNGETNGYQVSSPAGEVSDDDWGGSRTSRRTRGVVLAGDDSSFPLEQQLDEEQWKVLEASVLSDSLMEVAAELDRLEEEEEERRRAEAREQREIRRTQSAQSFQAQTSPISTHQVVAEVHRDEEEDEEDIFEMSQTDFFEEQQPPMDKVTRHPNTKNKNIDWNFMAKRKWLILGDSNVGTFPEFANPDLQVECFPGANFRHAEHVINKAGTSYGLTVEKVVLAFGINSRANKARETTIKNAQAAVRATKATFPYAEVYLPLLNFSWALPAEEKDNLRILNDYIQRNQSFIPTLSEEQFDTEEDLIHWTDETARAMFSHWTECLNLDAP